jgi:mannose-6-phosphate isomerase-like protein (cupin superfamily)
MNDVNRRLILRNAIAAIPLAALAQSAALQAEAQPPQEDPTHRSRKEKAFVVAPGESRYAKPTVGGGPISVKVSGADTGGDFALFEVPAIPYSGPPLHMHHVENEWFYVLEGEFEIRVGDEHFQLTPGASVFAPKMIPHTWQSVGETPSKMLSLAEPAGHLEAFLVAASQLLRGGPPHPDALKALFEKYDMEVMGPPLPKKIK